MRVRLFWQAVACLTIILCSQLSFAICNHEAHIDATPTPGHESPYWTYTITLTWGGYYGIHHWVMPLDTLDGTCSCADFLSAIILPDPAGNSDGDPDQCTLSYTGKLECAGDPLSYFDEVPCLTFTPQLVEGCEPGTSGTAIFQFQSDRRPVDLESGQIAVATELSDGTIQTCGGPMTGVFPSLPCDPVDTETAPWGTLKSMYR